MQLGYWLSSEERRPNDLVQLACEAERTGFSFAIISDHYHPWIDNQGQSPFVWAVLGGIAQATRALRLGTGVTCPMMRIHPAVIAQAAATVASMLPERFFLGVGSGENLNEHILGAHWPPPEVRLEMLEEAITVIRTLWEGGTRSHRGRYYTVQDARIYTRPDVLPPVYVAASGPHAAQLAARAGDGLIATTPNAELVKTFGTGKPRYGQVKVCWAADEASALKTVREIWPTAGVPSALNSELAQPAEFEAVASLVSDDMLRKEIVCGPDPERHIAAIRAYQEAGFDHVSVHQIGPDQGGFFRFYAENILPKFK